MLKTINATLSILLAAMLIFLSAGSVVAAPPAQADMDIVDVLAQDGRFITLVAALEATGVTDTLRQEGPFTLFAPTDEAFEKLPPGSVSNLMEQPPLLGEILRYHLIAGQMTGADLSDGATVETMMGRSLNFFANEDGFTVDTARVTEPDLEAANGVIHVVDSVLLPPGLESLVLVEVAGLYDPGGTTIAGVRSNIVDYLQEGGSFTTLSLALQTANLVEPLRQEGPFTLFAPTDQAFEQVGSVEEILLDPVALEALLRYHLVSGEVLVEDLAGRNAIESLTGAPLTITTGEEMTRVNNARILLPDVTTNNGVIHIIDAVLTPPPEGGDITCASNYTVQLDDWLSKIAAKFYGDPLAYPAIFEATNFMATTDDAYQTIADPNLIEVGQTLCIPPAEDAEIVLVDEIAPAPTDVADLISGHDQLTFLTEALQQAGLIDTLHGDGPFTILAPTDLAFGELPVDEWNELKSNVPELKNALVYHVLPGKMTAADLRNLETVETTLAQPVTISVTDDTLQVNDARFVESDLEASNGIVHLIDSVLLPPSE